MSSVGKVHLGLDDLSAFADGELEPGETREARAHLDACARCSAELAAFTRLDNVLLSTAPVDCAGSLELRSALLDGQLTAAEAAIARAHIQDCRSCATDEVAWLGSGQALRLLPAALPSARVDAAIRKLTEQPVRRSLLPGFSGFASGLGLRVGVAATLVLAIVIGLVPTGPQPEQAQAPNEALVSAVQQIVLHAPTNTFYVLQQQQAAVDAIDAASYALRTRISVGGKPTAIALDPVASRILVLDASRKSLIEIDPASNSVVRSSPVEGLAGTLTSVRVASDGKVVVTAARDPGQGRPGAPRPTPDSTAGEVAVLDTQRKLEIVRSVDVTPKQVITDPQGKGALFLSPSATTVVDSSYQPQRTLPGGVGAAYGSGGWIAVLGESGADSVLHLFGDGAPQPLRLTGLPLAVTPMPDGGFAVLLGSGNGTGRILVIDEAGAAVGSTPVEQVGRDLTYDPKAKRFAVANGGTVFSAALPAGIIARQPEQSGSPAPSAPPSLPIVAPKATPSPAPSASAIPLASPAASEPVARPSPTAPPGVPRSAKQISESLYWFTLHGQLPILTTSSGSHVWFLDQLNSLSAVDVSTGAVDRVADLPEGAQIREIAATQRYVFALDSMAGTLYVLDVIERRLRAESLGPYLGATGLTTDGGSQLWFASSRIPEQLFSVDAHTNRVGVYYVGMQVEIQAFDTGRGVWLSDGAHRLGYYDFRTSQVTHLDLPSVGSARTLLPDPSGTLWVGTTAGEVISVRGRTFETVANADRPIVALSLDPSGTVWYLAPSRTPGRFVYAPASGSSVGSELPGPATSLTFNDSWLAWLADPLGGFYLALETPRQ
jgi:DNA-binding beta-propeller fold protein YncE/streptogramin lyase